MSPPKAFQHALAVAAAFLLWFYPSKAVTDILVWGAFCWAIPRASGSAPLWVSPPGLCAILLALFPLAMAPFSQDPAATLHSLLRDLRLPALAFTVSVLATDAPGARRALRVAVLALLPIFAWDMLRLALALGPELMAQARYFKPYLLNHPNVSSLLAAASCLVGLDAAWSSRRRPGIAAGWVCGSLLSLAYLVMMASRGPQLAFAATAFLGFLLAPRSRRGRLAGLALALAALTLAGFNLDRINARLLDTKDIFSGREVVWKHTLHLVEKRPWMGYGYGKEVFQQVYADSNPPPSPHFFPHPHPHALFVLFQGGRPWLVLHAAMWLLLAWRIGKALVRAQDEERNGVALVALLWVLWTAYGIGDYPDNRLQLAFAGLFPLALAASRKPDRLTR